MSLPKQIGFYCPYTWDDSTYLACALAGLATRLGVSVSLFAEQALEADVHHRWDHLVLSGRRHKFEDWLETCTHVVWFDVHKAKLHLSHRSHCRNILVPLWQRFLPEQAELLNWFDAVACLHEPVLQLMQGAADQSVLAPVDPGLPYVSGVMPGYNHRVFVPIDSYTARAFGPSLFSVLRMLLEAEPRLLLTLAYTRNWDRVAFAGLGNLLRTYGNRVRVMKKPSHADRAQAYLAHDCTFNLSLRENTGLFARESLLSHRPVVVFAVEPFLSDLTTDSAFFIPCPVRHNDCGVPEAVPNLSDLSDFLRELLRKPQLFLDLAKQPWPALQSMQTHSQQAWEGIWDLT